MEEKKTPFTYTHKKSLQRRGLDPKDYVFVKETYGGYISGIFIPELSKSYTKRIDL